jgi:hypothetical protein
MFETKVLGIWNEINPVVQKAAKLFVHSEDKTLIQQRDWLVK